MKRVLILSALSLVFLALPSASFAGECVMMVTRVACPGNETESYKKCGGKPACEVVKETSSADACAKEAEKECENSRLTVTKSKTITATFDDSPVAGGKNFCDANRPDFNKCQ